MGSLDFGVFIPIANNGWIISTASPQYMPTFDLNKEITVRAEKYGFDFVLSMVKFRGYGGKTEFWDHAMESFTLMAGLAAVTDTIDLYASVAIPTIHPAIVARMAATIDDISHGRFGVNIVSGWNKLEYTQMGLWDGDEYYKYRYDYATEYVEIMKLLWENGRATYNGRFFQLDDCLCQPKPSRQIPIVCAGQSDRGMRFTAKMGNHNFILGGLDVVGGISDKLKQYAVEEDRSGQVGTYALFTIVAAETDAEAQAIAQSYMDGGDVEALAGFVGAASADVDGETAKKLQGQAFMGIQPVIGSYQTVASFLDRLADETSVDGVLFTFPDFVDGVTQFGERIMPLLKSRKAAQPLQTV